MSLKVFERTIRLPRPAQAVFSWLEARGALERLTPPWERIEVVKPAESLRDGTTVELRSRAAGFNLRWKVEHRDYVEGKQFRDVQLEGPFASWEHLHRVDATRAGESDLTDRIEYRPPGGVLGDIVGNWWIQKRLSKLFRYRHAVLHDDLEMASRYGAVRRMRIVVAGASGFVGRALVPFLTALGHEVLVLVRRTPNGPFEAAWEPAEGRIDMHALRGADVVINLSGANIADGRWTSSRREELRRSRLDSTRTLVGAIEAVKHRPFLLINASATGIYGSRGDERLEEESTPGIGFLAELCSDWELESRQAEALGIRVVNARFGLILSADGGALSRMLLPFHLGLGGPIGPRRHWVSWISRDDVLGALYHCMLDQRCRGPVNFVSPEPLRQSQWARCLGAVLRRPAVLPVPAFALRFAFGQMADETLLASTRVVPNRLLRSGYVFRHPTLEAALAHTLGSAPRKPQDVPAATRETGRRQARRRR
ncbi:MAG: TIGR01777 family oxidoreductase [Opitutaceae bacterium]|nr:TIGR01777 family oxidoreductase [Opitutaceae bacterium]